VSRTSETKPVVTTAFVTIVVTALVMHVVMWAREHKK
jgi:hypothetical protein